MNQPAPDFGVVLPTQSWSSISSTSMAILIGFAVALAAGLLATSWRTSRRGRRRLSHVLALSGVVGMGAAGYLVAAALPTGQITFADHDPPLIAALPGIALEPAPSRVNVREAAALLEKRYGLTGLDITLTSQGRATSVPEHIDTAAIARDLIVTGPDGQEKCALTAVALVDGDYTYQRAAIMCSGQELPPAPGHRPTGHVTAKT